jgi:hypothetical protein
MKSALLALAATGLLSASADAAKPAASPAKPVAESPEPAATVPSARSASANTPERPPTRVLHDIELLIDDGIPGKEYAKQLDYFKIELGAEDSKGQIEYASHLTSPKPERRSGNRKEDPRITIGWKKGTLLALDRKLLLKAGINSKDKKVYQFYPLEVEDQLFKLEETYAGANATNIARTRFKIRPKDVEPGYEFYIDDVEFKSESPRSSGSANIPAR